MSKCQISISRRTIVDGKTGTYVAERSKGKWVNEFPLWKPMSRSPESGFNPFDYSSAANLSTSCRRFARNPTRERGGGKGGVRLTSIRSIEPSHLERTNERTKKYPSALSLSLSPEGEWKIGSKFVPRVLSCTEKVYYTSSP